MNKKKRLKLEKEIKKNIPDEIKIIFGKFLVFSFIYLIFFFIIYPFILVNLISKVSSVILFVFLVLFYIYMIVDVVRKKKNYNSVGFVIIIPVVFIAISFSVIKFFI